MSHLTLRFLGGFEATLNDKALAFATDKVRAMLAYLATEADHAHTRGNLTALLWPDYPEENARTTLRHVLHLLRQMLADQEHKGSTSRSATPYLLVTHQTLQFNSAASHTLDVATFTTLLKQTQTHAHEKLESCPTCIAQLRQAVALYRGDFLADLTVRDSTAFEEWRCLVQERLHLQVVNALTQLAVACEANGDDEQGRYYATRLLVLDPYSDIACCLLMRAAARMGERNGSLATYRKFSQVLRDELNVDPQATTTTLCEDIRLGKFPARPNKPTATERTARQDDEGMLREIPPAAAMWGRAAELSQLRRWVVDERASLVAILGMGGAGKTTLAAAITREVRASFDCVIWRSMVNAPLLNDTLRTWLQVLSRQQLEHEPATLDDKIQLLLRYLRERRCLLILDNVETLFQRGSQAGLFQPSYADYAQLFQQLGLSDHQSCLMLTSREQPQPMARLLATTDRSHVLRLSGVDAQAGQSILERHGISPSNSSNASNTANTSIEHIQHLVNHYSGNPLALQLVSQTINDLFDGNVAEFQRNGAGMFGDIRDVLDEQFARMSDLEQVLLFWLAIERVPTTFDQLCDDLMLRSTKSTVLEALVNLTRRSWLERADRNAAQAEYALQNVVMEFVTGEWVAAAAHEILTGHLKRLHTHGLMKAQAKEYVRQAQVNLIVEPVAERLRTSMDTVGLTEHLGHILQTLRDRTAHPHASYAGGNILNLALHLQLDTNKLDFSRITLREAFLRDQALTNINFAHADLSGAVFGDTFSAGFNVAYNAAAAVLVASTSAGELRLWQADGDRPLAILRGHSRLLWALASNPQRAQLASGGEDGRVQLWDREPSPDERWGNRLIYQSSATVRAIAFHPSGQFMASAGDDPVVRVWNTKTGAAIGEYQGHTSQVTSLVFSPDGCWLASCADDRTVRVWHTAQLENPNIKSVEPLLLQELPESTPSFWCLAFAPDGATLVSGTLDGQIWVWAMPDRVLQKTWQAHPGAVSNLSFSNDGAYLASSSADTSIRVWDAHTLALTRQLRGHKKWVTAIAFHPDKRILASTSLDNTICTWDVDQSAVSHVHHGHSIGFDDLCFGTAEDEVIAATSDGQIRTWLLPPVSQTEPAPLNLHARIGRRIVADAKLVASLACDRDRTHLVTGGHDYAVRVWDLQRGELRHTLLDHQHIVFDMAVHPDGHTFASGSIDQTVRVWDIHTGHCLHTLTNENKAQTGSVHNGVWSVAYSPDGNLLAAGHANGAITIWAMPEARVKAVLRGHTDWVRSLVFTNDGTRLISGSNDHLICIWNMATLALERSLRIHSDWVMGLALHPTEAIAASCGHDHLICLWRTDEDLPAQPRVLRGHEGGVHRVAFSPSGRTLISAGMDGTLRAWRTHDGALLVTQRAPGRYEGLHIQGVTGITSAQRTALVQLGADES